MKKILIASYNLDFGGIETSLINLLKNMNLNKYKVTLVLERKEGVFLDKVPKGIDIKEYRTNNSKNIFIRKSINLLKRIKWLIFNYQKYDSSICYATYSGPCGFVVRTASKNKILFVHNDYYQSFKKKADKTKLFFNNLKIERYNHIVFVSNESRKNLEKLFPNIKDKMITINNLIDYKRILKLSGEIKIEKSKDKKVFLFVGRLDEEQKKVSRIIEVANLFKNKTEIEFWILGDGAFREKYETMIEVYRLKNVKLLGSKKNPYPYMKACDCILLTSDYEGFPVVYNEAIILNKPIITTVEVSDETINIDKRFGVVCNKDIKSIYKAIDNFVKCDFIISEQVDFLSLNEKRTSMILNLMEDKND